MGYHADAERIGLDELRRRIESTDLVPSRECLLEDIGPTVDTLNRIGIETLGQLRYELKSKKRLADLAERTGIDSEYLVLLRREIESYFPKPFPLKDFDWMPEADISGLVGHGIRNTPALYEVTQDPAQRAQLVDETDVDAATLDVLAQLVDMTRVQWVSPTAARMLMETGCDGAAALAEADADKLCEALEQVNEGGRFFKGTIGLRDVRRLVHAAGYTLSWA